MPGVDTNKEMPLFNICQGQYIGKNVMLNADLDTLKQTKRTCNLYSRKMKCYLISFDKNLYLKAC